MHGTSKTFHLPIILQNHHFCDLTCQDLLVLLGSKLHTSHKASLPRIFKKGFLKETSPFKTNSSPTNKWVDWKTIRLPCQRIWDFGIEEGPNSSWKTLHPHHHKNTPLGLGPVVSFWSVIKGVMDGAPIKWPKINGDHWDEKTPYKWRYNPTHQLLGCPSCNCLIPSQIQCRQVTNPTLARQIAADDVSQASWLVNHIPRNKGLIAGLVKGNQWLINP